MHSKQTPTDLHINLTEGNKLETQHWLLGFITNLEASKEERGGKGYRNMLEKFLCKLRKADFMPFPAKPSLLGCKWMEARGKGMW